MNEIQLASKKLPKCDDIKLRGYYSQTLHTKNHIPVASTKQVFKKRTPKLLTCTHLSQNVCCVK